MTREQRSPRTDRRLVRLLLEVGGTAVAFKLLAEVAEIFVTPSGASYIFPAAGVILAAGVGLGWHGVLGVYLGSLMTSWGVASTPAGLLAFTLIHATATAIAMLGAASRPLRSSRRLLRVVLYGGVVSQLVSAALGSLVLVWFGQLSPRGTVLLENLLLWWFGDAVLAVVVGLPLLLAIRPALLLSGEHSRLTRTWITRPGRLSVSIVLMLVAVGTIALLDSLEWPLREWMSLLLLLPIGHAAYVGGAGAALIVNLCGAVVYFLLVLGVQPETLSGESFAVLGPLWAMLALLTGVAAGGGLLIGAHRAVLVRLREHERRLERDFDQMLSSLSAAIEAKDPTTLGHVERVAELAVEVGQRLGLPADQLRILRYGALLHDVGKIGVPEAILNKPGELTEGEHEVMERHVEIGLKILADAETLREVLPLVRYHQERWDGRCEGVAYPGYYGLREEQIPLAARILAAVDSFDAMTNDRPYRAARGVDEAVSELRREAGRQFDPLVVQALLDVLGSAPHGPRLGQGGDAA